MRTEQIRALARQKQISALQHQVLVQHFDANETVFLERELTQLRARMFEVVFPELIARQLMPFATDIAPSAETFSYKIMKPVGEAKFIGHNSKDLPRVDAVASEMLGKVHPIGASYGWDVNELKEAARLNIPLSDVKAKTARTAVERAIDEVLATGNLGDSAQQTGLTLTGMTNSADVIAQGISAGLYWFAATPPTPTAVLNDLNAMVRTIASRTRNTWNANALLLPTLHYQYASQTPFSTVSGQSILSVFKQNNESIKMIRPWYRLDAAGVSGVPRGIAYQLDPMVLEGVVPQEFEQLAPEARGLEILINCTARCGGVKIYQPTAMQYIDFATS